MWSEGNFDLRKFKAQAKKFSGYAGDKERDILASSIEEVPEYARISRTLS
jgi:hypothetical protein